MELDIFNPLSDEELKELKSWKSFILGLKIDPILKKRILNKKKKFISLKSLNLYKFIPSSIFHP